jgi:hypothetical protein
MYRNDLSPETATEGGDKAPVNDSKNFSNSLAFRLSVCSVRGWQAPLRHHSPLVVVAPGPNAPVFFAGFLAASLAGNRPRPRPF